MIVVVFKRLPPVRLYLLSELTNITMSKLADENIEPLNELCNVLRPIYLRMKREGELPEATGILNIVSLK